MKQTTPEWPDSSQRSARFEPAPSRLLRSWWWFLHGLATLAMVLSSLELWWKCLAVAGVLAHARWRRVPPVREFEIVRPGHWSVPSLDRHELVLTARSRCGGWWIRLVLADARGMLVWTMYCDQLQPRCWRLLKEEVRTAKCGESGMRVRMR